MQRTDSQFAVTARHGTEARSASKGSATLFTRKYVRACTLACAAGFNSFVYVPPAAIAADYVEFDVPRWAECRDITPPQRIAQYPLQRVVEVTLPVSVRFHGLSTDDVDELDIEVSGASAGLRVQDFAPDTQLTSDISREIETTTTTKKNRSLDGTLGGTLPIPGAEAAAHVTPSIGAALSNCETATEKINRLPPMRAVVVSGTSLEGRGVFFKLKRSSQTSLEGVHELSVTFVVPRNWLGTQVQLTCAARGERKMLWMKQPATIGQAERIVQLVAAAPAPVRQIVLKPQAETQPTADKTAPAATKTASNAPKWRPARARPAAVEVSRDEDEAAHKKARRFVAADDSDSDGSSTEKSEEEI